MRTATAGFQAALATDSTYLVTGVKIERRDGLIQYFTDHDQDLTVNGNLFKAAGGFTRSAMEDAVGTGVNEVEIVGALNSTDITDEDLRAGLYNYAKVTVYILDHNNPANGWVIIRRGTFGKVSVSEKGTFTVQIRSLTERLKGETGELFLPECQFDLGDNKCTIPLKPNVVQRSTAYNLGDFIRMATAAGTGSQVYEDRIYECTVAGTTAGSAPAYDTTVGNLTVDGTATFKAYESWTRSAVVATVISRRQFDLTITESRAVDGWFTLGYVTFESGNNVGRSGEIRNWTQSGNEVILALKMEEDVQVGDVLRITPGCDKILTSHCRNKYVMAGSLNFDTGNGINHGGHHWLPGRKFLLKTAGVS